VRAAAILVLLFGCESEAPPPSPAPTGDGNAQRATEPVLLAEGQAKELRAALQGTFSMPWWRGGPEQHPEVWSVDGDAIIRWDGTKEEAATMLVVAPCLLKVTWGDGTHTYEEFVIDEESIWFGEEGGRTSDGRTVVCTSRGVWVLAGDTCTLWAPGGFSRRASGLNPMDATCSLATDGTFDADGTRFAPRGEVLLRADFDARRPKPPVRFPSLAEAKAAARTPP
jgi:hypothetical protein